MCASDAEPILAPTGGWGARREDPPVAAMSNGYPASRLRTGDPLPDFVQWVMSWCAILHSRPGG
jgi:hypothetical protein